MSAKKRQPQPQTSHSLISYLPFAFLWLVGILALSVPVLSGIDGAGDGMGVVGVMFLWGWIALCFGIPAYVHRTWKISAAMCLVALAIALVLGCLIVPNMRLGNG